MNETDLQPSNTSKRNKRWKSYGTNYQPATVVKFRKHFHAMLASRQTNANIATLFDILVGADTILVFWAHHHYKNSSSNHDDGMVY